MLAVETGQPLSEILNAPPTVLRALRAVLNERRRRQ